MISIADAGPRETLGALAMFLVGCWMIGKSILYLVRTRYRQKKAEEYASLDLDLADYRVRERLENLIQMTGVTGNANIRDGRVTAVPTAYPDSPVGWVSRRFRNAYNMIAQYPNAVNGELYFAIKNPGKGTGWTYSCAGISVDDLATVASLLEGETNNDN